MSMSLTYIHNTKYQFILIQIFQNSPKKIQKTGLVIYKMNLEINLLNNDNVEFLLHSNCNLIETKVNIGFFNICGILCYLYSTNNDIKEKGKIEAESKTKINKIKNINYIPLVPFLSTKTKNDINLEFNKLKKFLILEGLYFCDVPFRFDIDLQGQIESYQNINVKYKLFEIFQYNYDYAPNAFLKMLTPIVKGYYGTIYYINSLNEKTNIDIVMRYKICNNDKYLIETEIIVPPNQINKEIFQFIFYAYINETDEKFGILKIFIDKWIQNLISFDIKETHEKIGLIFNFYNKENESSYQQMKTLTNFEIYNLYKIKYLENSLSKFMEQFKSIGYNYKFNNIEYCSQNRLLILISDDFKNLFSMVKIVSSIIFSIFLTDRKYKTNIIKNTKEDIIKQFKNAKKKIKKLKKEFPKRIEVNRVNDSNIKLIHNIIKEKKENYIFNFEDEKNSDTNKISQNKIGDNNTIKLFIGTYNVNALSSELIKSSNLSPFIIPEELNDYFNDNNFPIFYCIGLEECVELNAKNVLVKPKNNKAEVWEERITSELQKKFNYYLMCKEQLVGILLLFYVKSTEIKYIRNIQTEKLKSGFMGCGNKGCCFLNFEYKGKSFGFCSSHLPSGQKEKNLLSRKDIFNHILDFKVGENEFQKNDYYFIFGDLNFRSEKIGLISLKNHIKIILSNKKAEEDNIINRNSFTAEKTNLQLKLTKRPRSEILIQKESNISNINIKSNKNLLKLNTNNYFPNEISNKNEKVEENLMDENVFTQYFFKEFSEGEELKKFEKTDLVQFDIKEGEITFPPTYKYKKNTNSYNIDKRVPSWTDRILYKNNENIRILLYDRVNLNLSDHKPIFGLFEINNT